MEKSILETIEQVCEAHNVEFVYVTDDNQIFLPIAKHHATYHCQSNGIEMTAISADGSDYVEKAENDDAPVVSLDAVENHLDSLSLKELHAILEDLKVEKLPRSKQACIELIGTLSGEAIVSEETEETEEIDEVEEDAVEETEETETEDVDSEETLS